MEYKVKTVHVRSGLAVQRDQVFFTRGRAESYARKASKKMPGYRFIVSHPGPSGRTVLKRFVDGRVET